MRWVGPALVALAATAAAVAHSGARSIGLDGEAEGAAQRRALGGEAAPLPSSYVSTFEIVATFPHDTGAFTQGLAFDAAGNLYESDGLYQKSGVRHVDVTTGTTKKRTDNPKNHFGEGISILGDRMLQLTWRENTVHEFELPSLAHLIIALYRRKTQRRRYLLNRLNCARLQAAYRLALRRCHIYLGDQPRATGAWQRGECTARGSGPAQAHRCGWWCRQPRGG